MKPRERRAELRARFPRLAPSAAACLADVEDGPPGWESRVADALDSERIGDVTRAARTVARALEVAPELMRWTGGLEAIVELSGASAWAGRLLSVHPGWAHALCEDAATALGRPPTPGVAHYQARAEAVAATASDLEDFDAQLRDLRTLELLRIALRELRDADVRETAAELSDFASTMLQAALDYHYPRLVAEVGAPLPSCRHLVIALGKLGGRELNFSSDIDLLFLYEHDEGGPGELTQHQFHVRLFERVARSLNRVTDRGRVFRVDTDLRPEGRTGPLCNSLASLERYYETWGREWERAAWIKARPVAGDLELFEEVRRFARPFVYRRSFDLGVVEGVLDMKSKIDRRRRGPLRKDDLDLKLGPGGIREIEFFVQGQQLLYGGREPRLRVTGTLDALRALEVGGKVNARDRELLGDAYFFLRKVEHRLQLVEDQQTHTLPSGVSGDAVARSLGFEDGIALATEIDAHTEIVHLLFRGLLGAVDEASDPPPEAALLLDDETDEADKLRILRQLGSLAPHTALAHLESAGRAPISPLHPNARPADARLGQMLLAECLASPNLDRALLHLPELVRSGQNHGAYLAQLRRGDLRRGVARILGASDLLARILVGNPALLPGVLFAGHLPGRDAIQATLETQIDDDIEASLVRLRVTQKQEVLRIAIAELAGALAPVEAQTRLSFLAEGLVEACLGLAREEAEAKYGAPQDPDADLVLLAGGTLGAHELGYRSDLDLSAVYVGVGETRGGDRPPVTLGEFYTRIVQRMLSFLMVRTAQGDLYPVDMRLRPSGSQGTLVASMTNFEAYHAQGRAHLWERMALVRSRVLTGAATELRARAEAAVARAAYGRPYPDHGHAQVHQMRVRMARARPLADASPALFNLKTGEGGLIEVEFLVQHLCLRHGGQNPTVRLANTGAALEALRDGGYLSDRLADGLGRAHRRLRQVLNWLRVLHDEMLEVIDLTPSALRDLALVLGFEGIDAQDILRGRLDADRRVVRRAYEGVVLTDSKPSS